MKLTNAVMVEYLGAAKQTKIRDDSVKGFYARFGKNGSADFILRYKSPITEKEVILVLGKYGQSFGQLTVLTAREEAKVVRAEIDAGQDPQSVRKDEVQAKRDLFSKRSKQDTSIELAVKKHLLAARSEVRASTLKEKTRALGRLTYFVGTKTMRDVTRDSALEMLDIVEEDSYSSALKLISYCSAFWNWAIDENGFEGHNPWGNMKRRKKRYKSKPKTRWLDDDELKYLADEQYPKHHSMVQRAILVCLYSNCRPGMATMTELSPHGMDWSEIKWSRREWLLSGERMKAHNEHIVPLSDQFYDLLREWWEADGQPESGPITHAKSSTKKYMRGSIFAESIKSAESTYTPHDFRRTVSTQLQRLKCPDDIRRELRAHVDSSDIAKVYDIYKYIDEKREWLQKWADHLDTLGFANLTMKAKQLRLQITVVEAGHA